MSPSHHGPLPSTSDAWPRLTLADWDETRGALQLWFQIVGKVRLALEPMVNHWWQVPLYVSSRGLTTSLMHAGGRGVEMEFNFIGQTLDVRSSDGRERQIQLRSSSVASFYAETMAALSGMGVALHLYDRPVEMETAVPFGEDDRHRVYEPEAAERFWLALLQAHRVMARSAPGSSGKRARCTSSGAQRISRPPGSPAALHHCIRAAYRTVRTGCNSWHTAINCRAVASGRVEALKDPSTPMPTLSLSDSRRRGLNLTLPTTTRILGNSFFRTPPYAKRMILTACSCASCRAPTRQPRISPAGTAPRWRCHDGRPRVGRASGV